MMTRVALDFAAPTVGMTINIIMYGQAAAYSSFLLLAVCSAACACLVEQKSKLVATTYEYSPMDVCFYNDCRWRGVGRVFDK